MSILSNSFKKNYINKRAHLPEYFIFAMLCSMLALTVVMPNSFKLVSAACISFGAVVNFLYLKKSALTGRFYVFLFFGSIVTVTYSMVGLANGAPTNAPGEIFLIYILFPFLWGINATSLFLMFDLKFVIKAFIFAIPVATATVIFYFWAFLNLGPDSVKFLIETPNVNIQEGGGAAAAMHVYGSFIFLIAGLMASPSVVQNIYLRYTLLVSSVILAFSSGRSALLLAIGIGIVLSFFARLTANGASGKFFKALAIALLGLISVILSIAFISSYVYEHFNIDFSIALDILYNKATSKGGDGRSEQFDALIDGIYDNYGLGSGHGVVASWYSDPEKPWRYELVWMASIFRVGFFGAFVYSLPFIVSILKGGTSFVQGQLDKYELFLFAGYVAAFIASNTNPYLEGYVFQWMYVLPMVYFLNKSAIRSRL